jgi:hypothetical protein
VTPRDRGGGGIEMAIIFPLLLFSVFAVAHLSLVYLAQQAALSVAQVAVEGERGWLAEPGAGQQRAQNFIAQLPGVLENPQVQITNDGEHVTATVTAGTITVIPWFSHTVSQTASAPVERLT